MKSMFSLMIKIAYLGSMVIKLVYKQVVAALVCSQLHGFEKRILSDKKKGSSLEETWEEAET